MRIFLLISTVCLISVPIQAQAPTATAQKKSAPTAAPRALDGKPDLSGLWETARLGLQPEGPDGKPTGQIIYFNTHVRQMEAPYQPWAVEKIKTFIETDDPMAHCFMAGVPRTMANPFPFQIVQAPGVVIFLFEWDHTYRIIPTDGRPHAKDVDPSFMGDSVGHWEGNTLVVDVTDFNDKTWLDYAGHFHTEALHIVERYRRPDLDTIEYEATIEDPNVMTKPWILPYTLKRTSDRVRENECIENEKDLKHLVGK